MFPTVFDTNIVVRMVLSKPTTLAGKLLRALREGEFRLVLSPALGEEIVATLLSPHLRAKHGWDEERVRAFAKDLAAFSILTPGTLSLDVPALAERDPDDLKVLAAAVEGGASLLVTQDKDLLSLGEWEGVRIVEVSEFYQVLLRMREGPDDSP